VRRRALTEFGRLSRSIDQIELDVVEREATPEFLMKLSIQPHLSYFSLSNTVRVLDIFGVKHARSTVHNWIHKADLQPNSGKNPDHVAVDETVIQPNDKQYWLYATVDTVTSELLHTTLEPTRNTMIAQTFLAKIGEKNDISDAVFLVDGAQSVQTACRRMGYDFRYEQHGNRNAVKRVFRKIKTPNYLFIRLFQQRFSRDSRRLD